MEVVTGCYHCALNYHHDAAAHALAGWPLRWPAAPCPTTYSTNHTYHTLSHSEANGVAAGFAFCPQARLDLVAAVCPLVVCTARSFLEPCPVTVTSTTFSQVCSSFPICPNSCLISPTAQPCLCASSRSLCMQQARLPFLIPTASLSETRYLATQETPSPLVARLFKK